MGGGGWVVTGVSSTHLPARRAERGGGRLGSAPTPPSQGHGGPPPTGQSGRTRTSGLCLVAPAGHRHPACWASPWSSSDSPLTAQPHHTHGRRLGLQWGGGEDAGPPAVGSPRSPLPAGRAEAAPSHHVKLGHEPGPRPSDKTPVSPGPLPRNKQQLVCKVLFHLGRQG